MAIKYNGNWIEFIKFEQDDIQWIMRELDYWYDFIGIKDLKVKFYYEDVFQIGVIVNNNSIQFIEHLKNYTRNKKINRILE